MLQIQNAIHISEYDREKRHEILMMRDQLSRLSYEEKNMFLFLNSTHTGDLESKTYPPFRFFPNRCMKKGNSNVNIVTMASGTHDLMGTLLVCSGTEGKRYAAPDTMFSLNPGLKAPNARFIPSDFLEMYMVDNFFECYFNHETNELRRLIESKEYFGIETATRLCLIDSVVLPEDLILDQDCTEDWFDVYGSTEWGN
jgi:hypothetical protein